MHHRRHRHRGFRPNLLGRRWYERERVVERLEEYQRDLEQELADVTDLLRRLQNDAGAQQATATV
ncbi:MAG: hypothetical protein H0V79_05290 [Actinobacteria bacterium]|nr:hypothetical protein [Actinomycetota bacterium]